MFSLLRKIFNKACPSQEQVFVSTGTELEIGVPRDLLPPAMLQALRQLMEESGIVQNAVYVMMTQNNESSYFIALDVDVPQEKKKQAIHLMSSLLGQKTMHLYQGPWPITFGPLFDGEAFEMVINQCPELHFYRKHRGQK